MPVPSTDLWSCFDCDFLGREYEIDQDDDSECCPHCGCHAGDGFSTGASEMTQTLMFPDLEEHPPLARRTGPATSHLAAEEVQTKLGRLEGIFIEVLADLVEWTAGEVAKVASERYGVNAESVRKRAAALVYPKHKIEVSGARLCQTTGKMATTYRVVQ